MSLTLEQINIEVAQFYELMPEWKDGGYDSPENAALMFSWLDEQNAPINAGSLMSAFVILRKMGKISPAPLAEDPAEAEARIKRAELQARLQKEQDSMKPLNHLSHRQMEQESAAREAEEAAARKGLQEMIREKRKAYDPRPSPIYFEAGPNVGRLNHVATDQALTEWKKRTGQSND